MPNSSVDVDSWEESACYPRRTFYPISDGPSIQNHRITKTDFRPCSTCMSRSQALLCLYTQRAMSDRTESTFVLLRYSFGGDRPSQTTHLTLFATWIHRAALETYHVESGISPATPPCPKAQLQRLPPILRTTRQAPISGCSKGSRGLSVLARERGIFTTATISPSLLSRQCPSHYAFRAGRNLPDKELRYLRTVIVTAAVYRSFSCWLHPKANPLP